MKIGAIILARLTSSRLPGKGLKLINGKPILKHIVDAIGKCKHIDEVIIATSNNNEDDELEVFCKKNNIKLYRGCLDDVAGRFLSAANKYALTHAVRINGDNLFVNPALIDEICLMAEQDYDFISNVPGRTFPKGMSVELVHVKKYEELYEKFTHASHFEHVTTYLYEQRKSLEHHYVENLEVLEASGVQLAIDTQYDFELAKLVFDSGFFLDYKLDLHSLILMISLCEEKMNFVGKHGPLLIAEIGGNHEGNFEYAKKLTQLAIESDSDFVKFQMYSGNSLVNPVESPERHKHFKKFELSREQYIELAKMVTDAGKRFMASIWDLKMIDWVDEYNPVYKIGSGDLLAWPLLKSVSLRGKPIILSTGLATEEEVVSAVKYIRTCNPLYNDPAYLSVLQCTSMYPIPKSAANLDVMLRLNEITGATMGYSDHTEGVDALKVATTMGAKVLEFHFTDQREGKLFRDHKVSLTKDEVLDLIEYIKMVNTLKGDRVKKPVAIEIDNGHVESFRRAIYPSRPISKGQTITEDDIVVLRPSHGLSSRYYDDVIGKKSTRDLAAHEKLSWDDFSQ
ncbi:N-acetylneuraminate synthase family protein [Vibrio vulnificus]|nr:N-acetylneuraminate synthase family protein [Vibrio vulnificus]